MFLKYHSNKSPDYECSDPTFRKRGWQRERAEKERKKEREGERVRGRKREGERVRGRKREGERVRGIVSRFGLAVRR